MNTKQLLVVLGSAALCGFALAQTPKAPTAAERLETLEKEVQTLRAEFAAAGSALGAELAALRKDLSESRALTTQLATWAAEQAVGAAELARVLDDSEQKGFTFGINPESRVVLLGGWRNFAAGLQKDAPAAPAADAAKAQDKTKTPARKKP